MKDFRLAARTLWRTPAFTLGAVLTLALGIGANTAMFSIVNATLFRASLVANPERLVEIYQNGADGLPAFSSYPAFTDMATHTELFAGTTAASIPGPVRYLHQGAVRTAVAEYATATYPSVLGLRPSLGRWFESAEDRAGADVVAVLGHRIWTTRFGGDPLVIGRTIQIEGVPVTIVGVGPASYNGTLNIGLVTDFWLPITSMPALVGPPEVLERRARAAGFVVKGRLRDGVAVAQTQAAMDILAARLAREYPNEDPGRGITVKASTDVRVHPQADGFLAVLATLLLIVVSLVLAIACSNLATLLLLRGTARAKEVSIRLALGATRRQIVWYLLTESALLSLAGGAAGCVFAWWAFRALSSLELPVTMDFSLDYRVLVFAIALSLLTGTAFGLAPALTATKVDLISTLRDEAGRGAPSQRWFTLKNALVVFQVAVSVVLLAAAGVFLRLLLDARNQPAGFAVDGVALLETDARYAGYSASEANRVYDRLRERIAAIPGVQATAVTGGEPMQSSGVSVVLDAAADAEAAVLVSSIWAGPGYFDTLAIPILAGRALDDRDRAGTTRVAVISESMARRHFGGIGVGGRRFRMDQDPNWIEVVGVARDTGTADPSGDLIDPTPDLFYLSSTQWDRPLTTVVARSTLDAAGLVGAMQRELRALDPALPVVSAKTMARHLEDSLLFPVAFATVLGLLGALGVGLAGFGLYAVVAFAVSRRSREIGIRMALGARSDQVVWTVAKQTAMLVGVGTAAGLVLSLIAILGLRQVSLSAPGNVFTPTVDPVALMVIAVFMLIVGAAAAYVPARRAAALTPVDALRVE